MLSKPFFAWVGVGLICVATIPVLAAPHLARLARKPVAAVSRQTAPKGAKVAKPKIAATKPAAVTTKPAAKPVAANHVKTNKAKKPAARRASAASTARTLLH